jgi:membrane-associated phospholipid phosphatase
VRVPRWSAPALIYAAIVAWSRCVLGVHYPSDVLIGSLLGAAIGVAVARWSMRQRGAALLPIRSDQA